MGGYPGSCIGVVDSSGCNSITIGNWMDDINTDTGVLAILYSFVSLPNAKEG
jgi:hypothetical protein